MANGASERRNHQKTATNEEKKSTLSPKTMHRVTS